MAQLVAEEMQFGQGWNSQSHTETCKKRTTVELKICYTKPKSTFELAADLNEHYKHKNG